MLCYFGEFDMKNKLVSKELKVGSRDIGPGDLLSFSYNDQSGRVPN